MPQRKKGSGYEDVRRYILDRIRNRECPEDPFVRIAGHEIAEAAGITPQSVGEHVRTLIRRGVIVRDRRVYFALAEFSDRLRATSVRESGIETNLSVIEACFQTSLDGRTDRF